MTLLNVNKIHKLVFLKNLVFYMDEVMKIHGHHSPQGGRGGFGKHALRGKKNLMERRF